MNRPSTFESERITELRFLKYREPPSILYSGDVVFTGPEVLAAKLPQITADKKWRLIRVHKGTATYERIGEQRDREEDREEA